MKRIENQNELQDLMQVLGDEECVLRLYDSKSNVLLQTIVVKHPIIFIRGIQEFCKSVNLPVSDLSVRLIGFITTDNKLNTSDDVYEISPYVYFKKEEPSSPSK